MILSPALNFRRFTLLTAVAGLTSYAAAPAHAQQMSPALDRFSLSVGAFSAKPELGATVGGSTGSVHLGDIDGERKTMPRISGEFLLGDNHGISFDAFRYSQGYASSNVGTYNAVPFGASTAIGVSAAFDLDVARLGYRYWFGTGNTVFGIGAGIGYYRVALETNAFAAANVGLAGAGFIGYNGNFSRQDRDDAVAPMLEVGIRHAISPDLRLFADASGIRKSGGSGVRGSIYNASIGAEWFPVRNLGVSLAYAVTDVDLKREDEGVRGLRVKFQGPVLAAKMRF
ncbi:MAG: hypothetical protein EOP81_01620 [Variovorax sp.]|nr:MAG: hypothetical protein EOP81_01620 [Variovorax sp.]